LNIRKGGFAIGTLVIEHVMRKSTLRITLLQKSLVNILLSGQDSQALQACNCKFIRLNRLDGTMTNFQNIHKSSNLYIYNICIVRIETPWCCGKA